MNDEWPAVTGPILQVVAALDKNAALRAERDALRDDLMPTDGPRRATQDPAPSESASDGQWHDTGNAVYFALRYGRRVRYDNRRDRWLLWRSPVWVADPDAEVSRLMDEAMLYRLREATLIPNEELRKRAVTWANGSFSRARLENAIMLARHQRPITDSGDGWDRDPWVLAVQNGVLDLRLGTLREGRPEDRLTRLAAVPYDPDATAPRWTRFLLETFPDDDVRAFVQRAAGYSLSGVTTEQVVFLLHGAGANGKSTFLRALVDVVGTYAQVAPFSTFADTGRGQSIPNDLAALDGARIVMASETRERTRLDEGRLKSLTGGDLISARFLHGEFFTFEPLCKLWLAANHRPVVADDSVALWRRMRLIPCTQRPASPDPTLGQQLKEEGPGILRWAVEGCLAWQRDGLGQPPAVMMATEQYREDSDVLADFLREGCVLDPDAQITAADLYDHYKMWARQQGMGDRDRDVLSANSFGRKMGERFGTRRTTAARFYLGLARRS